MYRVIRRKSNRAQRKLRVRKKIFGTTDRPRLTVFRSNKFTYCQLVDDSKGETLVSIGPEIQDLHKGKTKTEAAFEVGKLLAKKALEKNIKMAIFDRNGYKYHGRVKSIAEGAREGGLQL